MLLRASSLVAALLALAAKENGIAALPVAVSDLSLSFSVCLLVFFSQPVSNALYFFYY